MAEKNSIGLSRVKSQTAAAKSRGVGPGAISRKAPAVAMHHPDGIAPRKSASVNAGKRLLAKPKLVVDRLSRLPPAATASRWDIASNGTEIFEGR